MTSVEFLISALALWEILEIWHHSSIMASWRARATSLEGRAGELFRCMFCLAPWAALLLVLPLHTFRLGLCVLYSFALARAANTCNDLGYVWCRTPKMDQGEGIVVEKPEASE